MPDDTQDVISGGHLVAKALKAEGVDRVYTLCGGHIIDIYDGCVDEGIEVVDVRHEQVAAHAADGYARVTGRPGCAVVTAGPGTTDAVTGVANAFRAESPMLLIGGQGALGQHRMGSLQDLPHVDMMTPITKFAATVPATARVADMVSMAFRECFHGAPGPSFLEIPRNVLDAKVPVASARVPAAGAYRASTRSAGDPEAVEDLADLLVHAEKPAILLGSQVWTTRGTAAAVDLVRALDLPAYMNGAGRGTLPPGDPHHFQLSRRYAFSHADVIVVVGTPFDFRMGYGKRLSPDATVVQIDLDYRTVGKNRDIGLGIVGDPGLVLRSVADAVAGIIAALYQRERTGRGQRVNVAMQHAVLNLCRVKLRDQQRLSHGPLAEYPNEDFGDEVPRSGNASGGGQPGWAVRCAPGGPNDYVYVIVQPVGWRPLTELIGRPELAADPEWATPEARLPKLGKMFQLIEEWSATLPKWEVLERLNAHAIPCGPILSTREIIEDESLAANGMIVRVPHPERGEFVTVGSPLKLSDSPVEVGSPPLLGEHNEEIYAGELGLGDEELRLLESDGVI
ncbi:Formyl-CoA:oxalate CoA-transferase [Streptomyces fumanus]